MWSIERMKESGWNILGAICLMVGMTFINPYVYATKAAMYKVLKATVTQ